MEPQKRLITTPAGITLCRLDEIANGAARNFVIEMRAGRFHGFVVRRGKRLYGYVDRCPHMGLPLTHKLDDYLTPKVDLIACEWHGGLFQIADGACVGGPCKGQRLTPWPVIVAEDKIVTAS